MTTVLFDTNVVAYWHQDNPKFRPAIHSLFQELSAQELVISRFISAVTVQELSAWALGQKRLTELDSFLTRNFSVLVLDRSAALRAAALQQAVGRPEVVKPRSADAGRVGKWFRDAAIVGTAASHDVDVLVTADSALRHHYQPHFSGQIRIVEEG